MQTGDEDFGQRLLLEDQDREADSRRESVDPDRRKSWAEGQAPKARSRRPSRDGSRASAKRGDVELARGVWAHCGATRKHQL